MLASESAGCMARAVGHEISATDVEVSVAAEGHADRVAHRHPLP